MSLTKFTENTNVISELPDAPSMSAQEIKAKFDEAGTKIKNYLNNTLTDETEQLVSGTKTSLQTIISNLRTELISLITNTNQNNYPVGKIIMSTENTNPYSYLGFGTWELWGKGRVPVGVDSEDTDFNTAEKTGGEKTHKLTETEMPSHSHAISYDTRRNATGFADSNSIPFGIGGTVRDITIGTNSKGGNQPHNNLQPYITCYMWKRVS